MFIFIFKILFIISRDGHNFHCPLKKSAVHGFIDQQITLSDFQNINLKGLSNKMVQLKVVSVDRSLVKGEVPKSQMMLPIPSHVRCLQVSVQLIRALGIDQIIAILNINMHSAIQKLAWTGVVQVIPFSDPDII